MVPACIGKSGECNVRPPGMRCAKSRLNAAKVVFPGSSGGLGSRHVGVVSPDFRVCEEDGHLEHAPYSAECWSERREYRRERGKRREEGRKKEEK